MHQCEFCGSAIPGNATFCGQCGRTPSNMIEAPTMASGLQRPDVQDVDTAESLIVPGNSTPLWEYTLQSSNIDLQAAPMGQEEEREEERRRRAAMLGMGKLGGLAVEGQPPSGNVPIVQGTPQMAGVPAVQGTPQLPGAMGPGFHSSPTVMAPQIPASPSTPYPPNTTTTLHHPHPPYPTHNEQQGCGSKFIYIAISIPILFILSFIGLGLTVFAPGLALSGSANVEQGGTFTLHGTHFLPGSSVTLTLDDTIPLDYTSHTSPVQPAYVANTSIQVLGMYSRKTKQVPLLSNIVSAGGDGTFDVTITANLSWSIGKHAIKASESPTHRSAEMDITIYKAGTTPTPSSTETATPSVTASPSPTTTGPGLSCVNPSSLSLGPVSQGYNQPVSAQVTLCTMGTGTVNWSAIWDQNTAPWLHLDHTTGQITAPGQTQVNVSALASNVAPGSYPVILTFTGQPNNVTESMSVTFTVQAGCVNGTPNALSFSGVANVSNPAPQTVAITNCGPLGAWSASAQTNDGANWLSTSPTSNTLNAGATTNVTITASNLQAHLKAGTYTGTVTFKIGSATFTVNVRLTVLPTPLLSGTPLIIFADRQCPSSTATTWICTVTLTNTSTNASLTWSATSRGLNGVSFTPASGTLSPGMSVQVKITFPKNDCPAKGTLIFTGPGNTVNVQWYC